MNARNRTSVLAVAVALVAAFIYPASADQQLTKKWHPGHYINSSNDIHPSGSHIGVMAREILAENPEFVGVKIQFAWYELETAPGVYDFSQIVADLDYAHSLGKKVKLMIRERVFGCGVPWPLPPYMATNPIYEGGAWEVIQPHNKNCTVYGRVYLRSVMDRWIALWTALGPLIDSHPALALVSVQESAWVGIKDIANYDPTLFHYLLLKMHTAIADAFPNTVYTPHLNYRSGLSIEQVEEQMVTLVGGKKIGIGDPDVYVNEDVTTVLDKHYGQYWTRYKGVIPMASENQRRGYDFNSAREIYDFAVDTLGLHFMVWTPRTIEISPGAAFYFDPDVLAILNEENFRINTTPPSQLLVDSVLISPPENVRVILD